MQRRVSSSLGESSEGNMLLELLLFLPLLMFLLFVVMDFALELKQQSAMSSSLRGALLTGEMFRENSQGLLQEGESSPAAQLMLSGMAAKLLENLARAEGKYLEESAFKVELALVRLSFDSETGQLLSHTLLEPREVRGAQQSAVRLEDFLAESLSVEYEAQSSALAVLSSNGEKITYRSEAIIAAGVVSAEAINFFASVSSGFLGRKRTLKEFQFFPLRSQGGAL